MCVISSAKKKYLKYLKNQEVLGQPFQDKHGQFENYYLPICKSIYQNYLRKNKKVTIVGLSGAQGSGKTTITEILKIILKEKYNLNTVSFSIDDFYKTLSERKKLSIKSHRLFLTRGVPGTHDIKLLSKIFKKLQKKNFRKFVIPKFDKSKDDRVVKRKWTVIKHKPEIVIFEGWCVGAKHQSRKLLRKPLNFVEKNFDSKLIWRKKVNNQLKNIYSRIFKKIDNLIFLKVPNFQSVYRWRLLQEKKLRLISKNKKIMSSPQVKRFIMYYERTTKQMIKDLPKKAQAVLYLNKKHKFFKIKFN